MSKESLKRRLARLEARAGIRQYAPPGFELRCRMSSAYMAFLEGAPKPALRTDEERAQWELQEIYADVAEQVMLAEELGRNHPKVHALGQRTEERYHLWCERYRHLNRLA
jgi:hypothetical protein